VSGSAAHETEGQDRVTSPGTQRRLKQDGDSNEEISSTSALPVRTVSEFGAMDVSREYCDPYCIIHGESVAELSAGRYQTVMLPETQNPVWSCAAGEVPVVNLQDSHEELVRRRYMSLTVMDADVAQADDIVGTVVVWLGRGWGDGGKVGGGRRDDGVVARADFEETITYSGRTRGVLRGSYVIRQCKDAREASVRDGEA
jgi:C2 domain